MIRNNKGFMYTISFFLLTLLLLALLIFFFHLRNFQREQVIDLASSIQLYDLDSSLQYTLAKGFLRQAKLTPVIRNNSLIFRQNWPIDQQSINVTLQAIKANAENDFPTVSVNFGSFLQTYELFFTNPNLQYKLLNDTELEIPAAESIRGYIVQLNFTGNISSCSPLINTGGSRIFTFNASAPGTSCSATATDANTATVTMTVAGKSLTLTMASDGELTYGHSGILSNSSIEVLLNDTSGGYFALPIVLQINDSLRQFVKRGVVEVPASYD